MFSSWLLWVFAAGWALLRLLVAVASCLVAHRLPRAWASLVGTCRLSCSAARDLPGSGVRPSSPALAGIVLTTGLPGKPRIIILEQLRSRERVYVCLAPPPSAAWVETWIHPSCLIIFKLCSICPPRLHSPGVLIFPAALCCLAHTSIYSAVPTILNVFSCFCFVFESCGESPYTIQFFCMTSG